MIYLILSLFFGSNCEDLRSRMYNAEREFQSIKFCKCISGDVLSDYKSQAKKELSKIRKCDSLESRSDSLWKLIKQYK